MTMDKKIEADHKKDVNKTFSFDDVLTNELGQLGKYQVVIILIASLSIISSGYTGGEYLFTTARIPTRCLIPQCDSENPEYAPEWVLNAIPGTSTSSFDNCERYQNSSLAGEGAAECPREWFDTTRTEPCDQYVYENKLSVVYDFGLACNEWKRSQIGSIQILGSLAGQLCTGYASDRWGRRAALVVNALNCAWLGLARSFVHSYEWFLSAKVLEAALGHSAFSSCYILVTEFFGPERRVIAGATISTIYALGQVVLAVAAHSVPAWRPLLRVLYAPPLLIVVYFWIMPESVRWLLSKGRYEESEVILKRIAKINNRPLSDKSLEALRATAVTKQSKETPKEPWLPIQVLRSRRILLLCIVSPVWWMTNTLVYFGLSINAVNISGNRYMNYALMALVEIPGYWTAILLLDRIGRKPVLIAGYWLCAATQFAFAFLSSGSFALSLTFYLFSKYAIATVVTSTYLYTAELFPTRYRHSLFAFSSMLGRLGGVAAPLTPALALTVWEHFPSVLFGSFALLAGLLVFLTPETLGVKLPDTMEDAERLGSHTRKLSLPS